MSETASRRKTKMRHEGRDEQSTIDELGEHFSALLGPLGEILCHMQDQNSRALEQIEESRRVTVALKENNKRLVLLLGFVGVCVLVASYLILRVHLITLQLEETQTTISDARGSIENVLTISRQSKRELKDTKDAVEESASKVTLEKGDGGVSVVVRPSRRGRAIDAGRPVVKIPVTVPSRLRVEEEPDPGKKERR